MRPRIAVLLGLVFLATAGAAGAGQACEEKAPSAEAFRHGLRLAALVDARLSVIGEAPAVAMLGRVGSDVSKYGLRYTHAGLAHRRSSGAPWTVLHKLNRCGSDRAELFEQGLGNFFLDDPHEYRALVLVLAPAVAAKVLQDIDAGAAHRVDEPRYSVIANPFAHEFQNSNGWVLEFLAQALAPRRLDGRAEVQAWLRGRFRPDRISVDPLQRLGATLFKANVAFFDHPARDRLSGHYSIVSVESVARWLAQGKYLQSSEEVTLQP